MDRELYASPVSLLGGEISSMKPSISFGMSTSCVYVCVCDGARVQRTEVIHFVECVYLAVHTSYHHCDASYQVISPQFCALVGAGVSLWGGRGKEEGREREREGERDREHFSNSYKTFLQSNNKCLYFLHFVSLRSLVWDPFLGETSNNSSSVPLCEGIP